MHVLVSRGHRLLGLSNTNFWRKCRAGRYGAITFDAQGRQQVSVAAIERILGKNFTPDELQAVAGQSSRTAPTNPAPARERLLPFDPGFCALFAESQRTADQRHLIARGIHNIELPKIDPSLAPELGTQQIFIECQVEELLIQAVRERDQQWQSWVLNPIERAKFREGPPLLEFPELLKPQTKRSKP